MFTPDTEIHLLTGITIDSDYKNTLSWSSVTAQATYFLSKSVMTVNNASYQRANESLFLPVNYEQCYNCNYVMWKNKNFGNKWFYAFIKNPKYKNDNMTEFEIQVDVIQTWISEITMGHCYVEREHVADDSLWLHTIDEGLNIGDTVINAQWDTTEIKDLAILLSTTKDLNMGVPTKVEGSIYAGVYSGALIKGMILNTLNLEEMHTWLSEINVEGATQAVTSMWLMPAALVPGVDSTFKNIESSAESNGVTLSFGKNIASIDGYVPKNNKLFCYPYNYLTVSNNSGKSINYKYELQTDENFSFIIKCDIGANPTVYMFPSGYRTNYSTEYNQANFEDMLTLSNYPLVNWNYDAFAQWLAQNSVSSGLSVASGVLALGAGLASGNPIATGYGAISVANSIGSFYEKSVTPDGNRGNVTGGGNISIGKQVFTFYTKTIKAEMAKVIDDYFTRFGYKVNELKVPSLVSRPAFNYIKCIESNVFGGIPQTDLKIINDCFVKGITFWHNPANVGNYSVTNK